MLSLAGWPPTAGFFSKLFIFYVAWQAGAGLPWLVILALINSTISMVYYVNIVWRMFVVKPARQDRLSTPLSVSTSVWVTTAAVIALTIAFGWLLTQTQLGATSLFATVHP
jgi:NADH-quinone oxidoreductase subunit N